MQDENQQTSKQPSIGNALNLFLFIPILLGGLLTVTENFFGLKYCGRTINDIFFILILLIVVNKQKFNVVEIFNIKKINYRIALLSIFIGLAGCFLFLYLYFLIRDLLGPAIIIADAYPAPKNSLDYFLFIFGAVAFAPLCEEFFYRGYLLNAFKKFGLIQAVVFTSLFFGIVHMDNIPHVISSVFAGLIFGYLVYRTGSIFSSMLAHGVFNAIILSLNHFCSSKFNAYAEGHIGAILAILSAILMVFLIKMLIKETSPAEIDKIRFKGFWGNVKSLLELWQVWIIIFAVFIFSFLSLAGGFK